MRSEIFIFILWLPSVSAAYGVQRNPSGNEVRWRGRDVTLRIDPALERLLDAGQVRSAAVMASEAWRGFGNTPDITIQAGEPPGYDASNCGNGIHLLPRWPFDPRQVAVTVVTSGEDGDVLGVDVLVNGEQPLALIAENPLPDPNPTNSQLGRPPGALGLLERRAGDAPPRLDPPSLPRSVG